MPQLFPSRGFRRTRERSSGLLFAFGVDDLSTSLVTGQTLTITRATGRTVFDATGRVVTLAHSQPPWSHVYNTEEATWEPTLDIQPYSVNLCLQSENFGTTWSAIGTPTRTAAAATCGDLSLDLIGDDAAGTLEGYSQTITFTGNGTKGLSIFKKAGTSTSSVVRIRDTTAGATRGQATIAWSGGVPTVTATAGTDVGTIACANGTYRFRFQCPSVVAANTNVVEVYPATTGALATSNTGTVYAGGVQVEDFGTPTRYIKTTTATVAANKDAVSASLLAATQDVTVYGRTVNYSGINAPFFTIGGGGASEGQCYVSRNSANLRVAVIDSGATTRNVDVAMPSTSVIEFAAQFRNLLTAPDCRIDTGSGFSAYSATGTGPITWPTTNLFVGIANTTATDSSALNSGLRRLVIAAGARTLSEMRGLAV